MLHIFSLTDVGKKRQINQDYIYATKEKIGTLSNIFLLADGMGGHKAGDFASKTTVESILKEVSESDELNIVTRISQAIKKTNDLLYNKAQKEEKFRGMGTTLVVATINDNVLQVANIGDSRLYVINQKCMRQITRDHSYVEEMVRIGTLQREKAREHPDKNIITRAVGVQSSVEVDFYEEQLKVGDMILLCSDGLSNMVDDHQIQSIVVNGLTPEEKAMNLVYAANDNGGRDNISVIVITLDAGGLI